MVDFFKKHEEERIIFAIQEAECETSGEIRVHLEQQTGETPILDAAVKAFFRLKMDKTEKRNGVLFFIVPSEHNFAVIGDKGINEAVPPNFWDGVRDILTTDFSRQAYADGLCKGIELVGKKLKEYFPYQTHDKNELSDEISYGA
jgi:uncharacterized membrane protein